MAQAQLIAEVSKIIVNVTFVVSVLFTPVVSLFWPWWKHGLGRTAAAEAICLALAFLPSVLNLWFGLTITNVIYQWFVLACVGAIPCILVWRVAVTWNLQVKGALDGRQKSRTEQAELPEQAP
jgi:hypothetical protein